MSEYIKARTVFKVDHLDCLVQALQDINPHWSGKIEVHEKPVALFGYHGDRRAESAEIVIRREHVRNGANDIGFKVQADGTVSAIISAFDQQSGNDAEWLGTLSQHYAFRVTEQRGWAMGCDVIKTVNEDGTWRVVLRQPEVEAWQQAGRGW